MDEVALLTALHGGVFTTSEAEAVGLSRETLGALRRSRAVRRLARGVYACGEAPETSEARHLELCRALLVAYPDAVLAGRSAVVAHGLPTWGVPLEHVLLHRPVDRQVARSGAVIRAQDLTQVPLLSATGPTTSVAAAVVQLALDHGSVQGVVSADAALRQQLVTESDLTAEVARRGGHRRVQRAASMLRWVDPLSESPGESRLRVALCAGGLELESQFVVHDERGRTLGRADFRVKDARVLIEFDGLVKYADGGVDALVREKRREDDLRAHGWIVVRFTWADLEHPMRMIAAVHRAVAAARAGLTAIA